MKDYNLGSLAAGEEVTVNAPGNYIRVLSAIDDIKVKATSTVERRAPAFDTTIKPNGARITRAIYTQWRVVNTSSLAQDITLLIGVGRAEENEIALGDVVVGTMPDVIVKEQEHYGALAENHYTANFGIFGSGYNAFQLKNPSGSGINLIIQSCFIDTNSATTRRPSLGYQLSDATITGGTGVAERNNYISGTGPVAQGFQASLPNLTGISAIKTRRLFGLDELQFIKETAVIVPPGNSLIVYDQLMNLSFEGSVDWKEKAI